MPIAAHEEADAVEGEIERAPSYDSQQRRWAADQRRVATSPELLSAPCTDGAHLPPIRGRARLYTDHAVEHRLRARTPARWNTEAERIGRSVRGKPPSPPGRQKQWSRMPSCMRRDVHHQFSGQRKQGDCPLATIGDRALATRSGSFRRATAPAPSPCRGEASSTSWPLLCVPTPARALPPPPSLCTRRCSHGVVARFGSNFW